MAKPQFAADLSRLGPAERALLEAEYPRFSAGELARRRALFETALADAGCAAGLVYEAGSSGTAVHWLTGWPATHEAALLVIPGRPLRLLVEHYNHLPMARRIAGDGIEIVWGERAVARLAGEALGDAGPGRLGVVGRLAPAMHDHLAGRMASIADLNGAYGRARLIKSDEEISWMRIAAAFTDLAIDGLVGAIEPGRTEHELSAATQAPYLPLGGDKQINFLAVTSMAEPNLCVPPQFTSNRKVAAGDAVTTEISAIFWTYSAQVLRTIAVGPPSPLYRDLHAVAMATFEAIEQRLRPGVSAAELVAATSLVEEAGFSIWDDIIHGYGGGYLSPVLGTASRPAGPVPEFTYEAGMMLVVQPNVITTDFRAGVQTGELLLITQTGVERLHAYPRGMIEL